jgi:hypothetical protein
MRCWVDGATIRATIAVSLITNGNTQHANGRGNPACRHVGPVCGCRCAATLDLGHGPVDVPEVPRWSHGTP